MPLFDAYDRDNDADNRNAQGEAAPGDATQIAMKEWFREIDTDRNGCLSEIELRVFLQRGDPSMTAEQCRALFRELDRNNSGEVSFSELVDFVFAPASPSMPRQLAKPLKKNWKESTIQFVEHIQEAERERRQKPQLERVEIFGAKLGKRVNGVYSLPEEDWVVVASAGVSAYDNMYHNDRPLYICSKPSMHLFYGWTKESKRVGWFFAKRKPPQGDPVIEYTLFNSSQFAQTPDLCWAPWQASDGSIDKMLLCEAIKKGKERGFRPDDDWEGEDMVDQCAEHELWPWLEDIGIPNSDCNPHENDWNAQEGEIWPEPKSDSDSDFEVEPVSRDKAGSLPEVKLPTRGRRESLGYELIPGTGSLSSTIDFGRTGSLPNLTELEHRPRPKASVKKRPKKKKDEQDWLNGGAMNYAPGFKVVGPRAATRDTGPMARTGSPRQGPKFANRRSIISEGGAQFSDSETSSTASSPPTEIDELAHRRDGQYVDESFPANQRSLDGKAEGTSEWARLPSMNPEACLFRRIVPDDIVCDYEEGNLWFMSACAAVAEYPAWLQNCFGYASELSPKGKYVVRLFHPGRGSFVRVSVDDYVPTSRSSSHSVAPEFAGITSDGGIWVALIEKAFAKLCGSYANTSDGDTAFGMHYLCGGRGAWTFERITNMDDLDRQSQAVRPSSRQSRKSEPIADPREFRWLRSECIWRGDTADAVGHVGRAGELSERASSETKKVTEPTRGYNADQLWAKIRRFMEICYPVAVSLDAAKERETGLLSNRLYSLIGAREVPVNDSQVLRMVSLRNPFGVAGWKGRWSRESDAWEDNPGVTDLLNYEPKKDGSFWMSFTDFIKYFTEISVCRKSMPVQGATKEKSIGLKRGVGLCTT